MTASTSTPNAADQLGPVPSGWTYDEVCQFLYKGPVRGRERLRQLGRALDRRRAVLGTGRRSRHRPDAHGLGDL